MFEPRIKVSTRYLFVCSLHSTHVKIINLTRNGEKVLDVGCGDFFSKEPKKRERAKSYFSGIKECSDSTNA